MQLFTVMDVSLSLSFFWLTKMWCVWKKGSLLDFVKLKRQYPLMGTNGYSDINSELFNMSYPVLLSLTYETISSCLAGSLKVA